TRRSGTEGPRALRERGGDRIRHARGKAKGKQRDEATNTRVVSQSRSLTSLSLGSAADGGGTNHRGFALPPAEPTEDRAGTQGLLEDPSPNHPSRPQLRP